MSIEEKLIKLVRNKPFLYDKKNKSYRNKEMRDRMWKNIASELKIGENEVRKKWKSLRDQFSRYLKASILERGKYKKKFKYFELLNFLKDTYSPRKCSRSLEQNYEEEISNFDDKIQTLWFKSDKEQNNKNITNFISNEVTASPVSTITPQSNTPTMIIPSKSVNEDDNNDKLQRFLKELKDTNQKSAEDEISTFVKTVENLLRISSLNIVDLIDLQVDILNLIKNKIKNNTM